MGFEVELVVTPEMAHLREFDSGIGSLKDNEGISTLRYLHSTLPIQDEDDHGDPSLTASSPEQGKMFHS